MHLVQGTPNMYIQEPGLLRQAGEWVKKYGKSIAIITGQKSWQAVENVLLESLKAEQVDFEVFHFCGECSYEEVDRLAGLLKPEVDLIVGVGGGKVLDTAKALAAKTDRSYAAIPTLAATCAAVTPLSVMYTPSGVYCDFPLWPRTTLLTLVDTEIIAHSPVRYLISGIGDTLAKWYEALASSSGKPHNLPTIAGLQAAKLCLDTLLEHSAQAVEDIKQQKVTDTLELVIDTIILVSGMVGGLGYTNCRSAAAHAIHNGITYIPESHEAYHGEKVAFGILVQLVLEGKFDELQSLLKFYRQCGLPATFEDLGIDYTKVSKDDLREVARISLLPESTMGFMPFTVTETMILDAIEKVQQLAAPQVK